MRIHWTKRAIRALKSARAYIAKDSPNEEPASFAA